jgi:hypothetical protein
VNRQFLLSVALLALVCAAGAYGADSLPQLVTRVYPKDGKPMLEVSGTAPDAGDWLAVTFFRPGERDSTYTGERTVYSVKGTFLLPLSVPAEFGHGSYEVGLWRQRLTDSSGLSKPVRLKACGAGSVATGANRQPVADSLAELATDVSTRDGRRVLAVRGTARDSRWLLVTFRRPVGAGGAADSSGVLLRIPKGEFCPEVAVPIGYEGGTYVATLWVSLAQPKASYRLNGLLASESGPVRP